MTCVTGEKRVVKEEVRDIMKLKGAGRGVPNYKILWVLGNTLAFALSGMESHQSVLSREVPSSDLHFRRITWLLGRGWGKGRSSIGLRMYLKVE